MHAIPIIFMCILQGTFRDKGIPCTFWGGTFAVYTRYFDRTCFASNLAKIKGYLTYIQARADSKGPELSFTQVP